MAILIETIDSDPLFDASHKKVVDLINKQKISGREKWASDDFKAIYLVIKKKLLTKQDKTCLLNCINN